jgi:hypothetical protein
MKNGVKNEEFLSRFSTIKNETESRQSFFHVDLCVFENLIQKFQFIDESFPASSLAPFHFIHFNTFMNCLGQNGL